VDRITEHTWSIIGPQGRSLELIKQKLPGYRTQSLSSRIHRISMNATGAKYVAWHLMLEPIDVGGSSWQILTGCQHRKTHCIPILPGTFLQGSFSNTFHVFVPRNWCPNRVVQQRYCINRQSLCTIHATIYEWYRFQIHPLNGASERGFLFFFKKKKN
jgi:hypothetical protein